MLRTAVLYLALAAGANAADLAAVEALREGSMQKLVFSEAKEIPDPVLASREGGERRLSDWRGKWVLVNFWATWCAPCRKEMPMLDALEREFGGEGFAVVTVATGRNAPQGIDRFFAETGVTALPVLLDPQQRFAREMAVLGLPVTVLIDPEGREVARMLGDAEWNGESARAMVAALLAE